MSKRFVCVLSGGAGTRLWPLSRESFPKQFYELGVSKAPLLIETLQRLDGLGQPFVLTTEGLRFATMGILKRFKIDATIVGEPEARNTAPAVALMTWLALREDPEAVVGVFPSDHAIARRADFVKILETAFDEAARGAVVTLGIRPERPATGYGYMELNAAPDYKAARPLKVMRFIEKPAQDRARELIAGGRVVWNAGMFVFSAGRMASHFEKHMPELWKTIQQLQPDGSNLKEIYPRLPKQSLDYGVMEKLDDLLCVPADIGWSDLGSWEEIAEKGTSLGTPVEIGGEGNFYTGLVHGSKRVAFVGLSDVFVIDTPDALLLLKKGEGQRVKDVVESLKKESSSLLKTHMSEDRPWGRFEVLMDNPAFKAKRIIVWQGQKLSYQSHAKRAEHWVVVRGDAEVTLDERLQRMKTGDHLHIPVGSKHRIANVGSGELEFIEVQTGSYFGEDDIVRFSDDYGRV